MEGWFDLGKPKKLCGLFFILFNEYNRSGSDILTNNVVLLSSEIDVLYRENVING